ncbi:hypothetical protein ACSVH5_08755 [Flavobacterium sp. RSSA_27]|uniref:hypothetical protein n=1 Tax=Flavobacterium sp. RSSA_27 TaxID=3447667 RepID=UPI003F33DD29
MKNHFKTLTVLCFFALCSTTAVVAQKHDNKKNDKSNHSNNGRYNNNNNYNNDRYDNDRYDNDRYDNDRYSKDRYNNDRYSSKSYNNRDLVGRQALTAYSMLRNRNFYEQKSHQEGGNTYKVWYNRNTRQCLKTTSRDRRITSVVSSSNCRY